MKGEDGSYGNQTGHRWERKRIDKEKWVTRTLTHCYAKEVLETSYYFTRCEEQKVDFQTIFNSGTYFE